MIFRQWLLLNRITLLKASKDLNYSYSQIVYVACDKRKPGKKLAKLIYNYTNGEVDFELEKTKKQSC